MLQLGIQRSAAALWTTPLRHMVGCDKCIKGSTIGNAWQVVQHCTLVVPCSGPAHDCFGMHPMCACVKLSVYAYWAVIESLIGAASVFALRPRFSQFAAHAASDDLYEINSSTA
jgi:hypothetical protein